MSGKTLEKNTVLCCVIFAVYTVLTFIGAANHELWFDEAQAWLIARDNTISGIFHQIGYEGHPPLWYMILYVPSHLGLPCTVMPYISWFITAAAGAIIMFKAPFHIAARSAVLFSGGFLFLNSVMSRVYCLINLIIVLIACLYPHRKKYPILYGLLIALLANTHICMSGFIGIIGIFMIIDLFKDFRSKGTKQNFKEITGLAIAGIGVLMMVIPLINSLSLNVFTSDGTVSASGIINSFVGSFINISVSIVTYVRNTGLLMMAGYFLAGIMGIAFVIMIIIMRHKTRPFLMLVLFWVFYTIATEIFWATIPNRALIFAEMYFVIAWIAEYEPQNNSVRIWEKFNFQADTKAFQKLIEFIKRSDKNFRDSYIILLTSIMLISVPCGAYYLFSDYAKPFSLSEAEAEYIRDNIPEESVIVTYNDSICSQISAYLPEYKFYSTEYERFYTYCSHEKIIEITSSEIYDDLKEYNDLYFVYACSDADYVSGNRKVIYSIRGGMPYETNALYFEISEYELNNE